MGHFSKSLHRQVMLQVSRELMLCFQMVQILQCNLSQQPEGQQRVFSPSGREIVRLACAPTEQSWSLFLREKEAEVQSHNWTPQRDLGECYNSVNPPQALQTSVYKNDNFQNPPSCKKQASVMPNQKVGADMLANQATLPWQVGSAILIEGVLWWWPYYIL